MTRINKKPAISQAHSFESVVRRDFLVRTALLDSRRSLLYLPVKVAQLLLQEINLLLLSIDSQVQRLDQLFGKV